MEKAIILKEVECLVIYLKDVRKIYVTEKQSKIKSLSGQSTSQRTWILYGTKK